MTGRGMLARLVVAGMAVTAGTEASHAEWHHTQIGRPSEGGMFGMARGKYGPIMFRCWDDRAKPTADWVLQIDWVINTKLSARPTSKGQFFRGKIIMDGDFYFQSPFKVVPYPDEEAKFPYVGYRAVKENYGTLKRLFDGLATAKESVEIRIGDESAKYSVVGLADAVGKMLADCGIRAEG